jgi:enoyl-CoA hydratase/carnithine racemase
MKYSSPVPDVPDEVVKLSFPAEHVLQISMNRPKQYNAMNKALESTMTAILDWFEAEPELWVVILASTSRKAWCAGQDLKELVGVQALSTNSVLLITYYTGKPGCAWTKLAD